MESDKEQELELHFIEEANTHLNTIEAVLSEPQINIHNINNAMRAAHSIKGGAAMMNFDVLSHYAHQLEDAFKVLKTKKQNFNIDIDTDDIQPLLLACVECLRQILLYYKNDTNDTDNNYLTLEKIIKTIELCFNQLHEILGDANPEDAATILATEENSQAIIPLIFQTQVEDYLQRLESLILQEPDSLREELVTMAGELAGLGYMLQIEPFTQLCESVINSISNAQTESELLEVGKSALQAWRQSQSLILDPPVAELTPLTPPVSPPDSIPYTESNSLISVEAKQLEVTNDLSNELAIQSQSLKTKLENLNELFDNLKDCGSNLDLEYRKISSNTISNTINKAQLKALHTHIVKLQYVINNINFKLTDFNQVNSTLNRTAQYLQNQVTQILMRPLTDILEPFSLWLRDLSIEYNKPVQLQITGAVILIECNILDTLQKSLLHILQNAFHHGIEDQQTRRKRGKPEQGLIEINVTTTQNNIVIVVSDDGCGIAIENVKNHAQPIEFDSTLNQIGGNVKVSTQPGKGTQFTLTIPFNVFITQVLFIESNSMLLACPISSFREVLYLKKEDILLIENQTENQKYFYYKNNNIPLINLSNYLHFNCNRPSVYHNYISAKTSPAPIVLIIDYKNQTLAIILDNCWGEQEAVIRRIEGNIPLPTGFSNCTITSNGKVVPVINWNELLSSVNTPTPTQTVKNTSQTILVIDDSTNIRNLIARTLQKAGYQVEEASDGLQGLEKLKTGLSIKAVICDIDMPNLDGLGFLARVKSQQQFQHIPIILLTSHTGNKYRQIAYQLGAKAYLCKPYNEYELLKALNE